MISEQTLIDVFRQHAKPLEAIPTGQEPSLPKLEGIKAVIFDIYGTLFISGSGDIGVAKETARANAFFEALEACGFSISESGKAIDGFGLLLAAIKDFHAERKAEGIQYPEVEIFSIWKGLIDTLISEDKISGDAGQANIEKLAVEYEIRVNPVWPMPGVDKALRQLADAGYKLGIVSNAQAFTPLLFDSLLETSLASYGFDESIQTYSFAELEAKPSTAIYSKTLEAAEARFGIAPQECLYVGNDMLNDITPSAQTGFKTCLFAGDKRSLRLREDDERVHGIIPDSIITGLDQLPGLLS